MIKGLSRVEWILGILLVVLLGVVLVLVLLIWFQPQPGNIGAPQNSATIIAMQANNVAPTPEQPGQTAVLAYAAAQQAARGWQTDAVLLNATASWPQGAGELLIASGQAEWRFTFYSPQAGQAAFIRFDDNQQAVVQSTSAYTPTSEPVAATAWTIDSVEATQIFLDAGGRDFLNQEQITVFNMSLEAENTDNPNQLTWALSMLAPGSNRALTLTIDATNGAVVGAP